MSLIQSFGISRSGLQVERMRMDVVANNIANMNSTRQADGSPGPYQRQVLNIAAQDGSQPFPSLLAQLSGQQSSGGVSATAISNDPTPGRVSYDPGNPDADAQGNVTYPNVDLTVEMSDMMGADRSYQANATALNAIKSMAQAAIGIGGSH
jgi:flagellar basal-body rod protein FlgC